MVPRVTAWDSELSPTASAVSGPTGVAFATWERVPDSQTADLEAFAARRR